MYVKKSERVAWISGSGGAGRERERKECGSAAAILAVDWGAIKWRRMNTSGSTRAKKDQKEADVLGGIVANSQMWLTRGRAGKRESHSASANLKFHVPKLT